MFQTVAVIVLLVGALLYVVRRVVRTVRSKENCGCGCQNCPMKGNGTCNCKASGQGEGV